MEKPNKEHERILEMHAHWISQDGKVCKYCRMLENGDVPEDRESVFNITVGNLSGTDVRIIGTLCNNELNVCLDTGTTDKGYDVRIRYCPMCGRDLSTPFTSQKGRL